MRDRVHCSTDANRRRDAACQSDFSLILPYDIVGAGYAIRYRKQRVLFHIAIMA